MFFVRGALNIWIFVINEYFYHRRRLQVRGTGACHPSLRVFRRCNAPSLEELITQHEVQILSESTFVDRACFWINRVFGKGSKRRSFLGFSQWRDLKNRKKSKLCHSLSFGTSVVEILGGRGKPNSRSVT